MKRWERWSFNALNLVVAVTGFAYAYMKYLLASDDPFAVINHAWQPSMLAAHVLVAPFLILLFGIVLRSHILKKLLSRHRPNRRTGWTSLVSFAAMALSGYLLQVASSPAWLSLLVVLHIVTSVVFVVGYGAHLVIAWRLLTVPDAATSEARLPATAQLPL